MNNSVGAKVHCESCSLFKNISFILSIRNGDSLCLKIILVSLSFVYAFLTFIMGIWRAQFNLTTPFKMNIQ